MKKCSPHKWTVITSTIRIIPPSETGRRVNVSVAQYRCDKCGQTNWRSAAMRR